MDRNASSFAGTNGKAMDISGTVIEHSTGRGIAGTVVSLLCPASAEATLGLTEFCGAPYHCLASTQTKSDGTFSLCGSALLQLGAEGASVTLIVEKPRLLFDDGRNGESEGDRVLQAMQLTVGIGGATNLRVPVQTERAHLAGVLPQGYAAASTAMLRASWNNEDAMLAMVAPLAKPRFDAATITKKHAKAKLGRLSSAPTALRRSGFLLDHTAPQEALSRAKDAGAKRLKAYAAAPGVAARVWISPVELARRLGVPIGPSTDGIPLSGSICDLLNTEKGPELERVRSLLDQPALVANEGDSDVDPDSDADGRDAPGPVAVPVTIEEALARATRQRVDALISASDEPLPIDGLRRLSESVSGFALPSGPADDTAYHDFYSLQIAFEHVWAEAFDGSVRADAEALYSSVVQLHEDYGLETSWIEDITDVASLRSFLDESDRRRRSFPLSEPPMEILAVWPSLTFMQWNTLSCQQQAFLRLAAAGYEMARTAAEREEFRERGRAIIAAPQGALLRIEKLILGLRERLQQPHGFHYFAPNSVNYGILLTYRQRWTPERYQVGKLVATIPLAPSESRKLRVESKISRSRSEQERRSSMSAFRDTSGDEQRAESEIVRRARTATNFQQTVQGSLSFGLGQIGSTSMFGLDQANESAQTKRAIRQAVRSASQEYRNERQLDVKTAEGSDTVTERAHEISNPNDEITVTYLLYELERRYRVSETLHRLTPVVMVAQDVPAPHEIDDDWLITHSWILRRVLLDDDFRKALDVLTDGFVGDEASVGLARQAWELQKQVVEELKSNHAGQQTAHSALEQRLVDTMMDQADAAAAEPDEVAVAAKAFATGGWSLLFGEGDSGSERFEAMRKALELRLEQLDRSLAQARSDLKAESSVLEKAQAAYTDALRKQLDRRTLVDQLRVHVKDNILFYMQAIWDHEPPDQRFFRLYHVEVPVPKPPPGGCVLRRATPEEIATGNVVRRDGELWVLSCQAPDLEDVEIQPLGLLADLDRPLGFKGNYIIYPLRKCVYLTDFMMQEYVDDYIGIRDPDALGEFATEELVEYRRRSSGALAPEDRSALDRLLARRLTGPSGDEEQVVVPTGQLMMEVLPGEHPVLERFKRLHRAVDLVKVENEVRMDELEALRYAARLTAAELGDPEIDRHIVVEDGDVTITPDT